MVFAGLVALLVLGYFVYKYTYIYTERRKYAAAEVAIQKVAADLRSQGIETEFSRGCGRTQEVYGKGSLTCSVSIIFKGDTAKYDVQWINNILSPSLVKNGFIYQSSYNTSFSTSPQPKGASVYRLSGIPMVCNVQLNSTFDIDSKYQVDVYCGQPAKFDIF